MLTVLFLIIVICFSWWLLKLCLKISWGLIKFIGFMLMILAIPAFITFLIIYGLSVMLIIPFVMAGCGIPMFRYSLI